MWQDISSISLGSEPTDGCGQAGEHDSHPSKGGRGEGRKSHGGLYGAADPLYSTRRRSMTSNHLQALPIQRHVHHESDHMHAETHTCTRCRTACWGRGGGQNGWRDRLMKRGVNGSGGMGDLKETDYQEGEPLTGKREKNVGSC